jgi:undecaprenyl-diphosphatase
MTAGRAAAPTRGLREAVRESAGAAWGHRHDPHAQWLAALAIVFLAAAAAFGHVVEDYLTGDPIVRWDLHFARWLHEHSSPARVDVFDVVTLAGNAVVLGLLTLVALVLLVRRRDLDRAALVVVVAGGIEVLNALLKLLFHRPRPELAFVHLDTYSFPSGHAAGSAAVYGLLAVLVARGLAPWGRWLVGLGTTALLLAIGFSRLYLGAHYLSDVLAGLALGLAWTAGWLLAYEAGVVSRLVPTRLRRRSRPDPGP